MLTEIGYLVMNVRDFDACWDIYGREMGLPEIARGTGPDGRRVSTFAVGPSVLEIHENPDAVCARLPSGDLMKWHEVPGSVRHLALLVPSNDVAYAALRKTNIALSTKDGPQVQPLGHTYLQRSLLEFKDPSGYVIQTAEVVDPRGHMAERRAEKAAFQATVGSDRLFQGFDHINWCCSDLGPARDLLQRKLGMREISFRESEGNLECILTVGCTDIELCQLGDPSTLVYGPGIVTSLGFWSDDVDGAYQALKGAGVAVGEPPALVSRGEATQRRAFTLVGPDGLPIEIAQRV